MHRSATQISPALNATAAACVLLGVGCALLIGLDLVRRPQKMWIMNLVWPLTALYAGPLGLWAYAAIGRRPPPGRPEDRHQKKKPFWQSVLTGALHCGAGCTLGDIVAEWLVFATGALIFGSRLGTKFACAFVLAYAAGLFFQFFSIAPMRGLGVRDGLWAAIKADTLSLAAYELGMFAWMTITQRMLFPGLAPTSWVFWFMMQAAMLAGLATTYPVNWRLIRSGVKEAM